MRKLSLLFVALLMSSTFLAQEHLDFRGVPIDGRFDNFIVQMESIGYEIEYKNDYGAIMTGRFTNKNVKLIVLSTPKTNTVWKVSVAFEEAVSWSSLKSSYKEYKQLYTKKYGIGDSYEFFIDPYYDGDGYELQALELEKCRYMTFFETTNGTIAIELNKSKCLQIGYEDKINSKLAENEKTSSALDEI